MCTGSEVWTPLKAMCLQPHPSTLLCHNVNFSLNNDIESDEHVSTSAHTGTPSQPSWTHFHMEIRHCSIMVWQQATLSLSNTNVCIHFHIKSNAFSMVSTAFLAGNVVHVSIKGSDHFNTVWKSEVWKSKQCGPAVRGEYVFNMYSATAPSAWTQVTPAHMGDYWAMNQCVWRRRRQERQFGDESVWVTGDVKWVRWREERKKTYIQLRTECRHLSAAAFHLVNNCWSM